MTTEIVLSSDLSRRLNSTFSALSAVTRDLWKYDVFLVGGLMVAILGEEAGRFPRRARATEDADVLVDLVAAPELVSRIVDRLTLHGFRPVEEFDKYQTEKVTEATCRFRKNMCFIDILCPEDASEEQLLSAQGFRSLAAPGSRRAMRTARDVSIQYDPEQLPLLMKVSAARMIPDRDVSRHVTDALFLASLVDAPIEFATDLTSAEKLMVKELEHIWSDDSHESWDGMADGDRLNAQALLEMIVKGL